MVISDLPRVGKQNIFRPKFQRTKSSPSSDELDIKQVLKLLKREIYVVSTTTARDLCGFWI